MRFHVVNNEILVPLKCGSTYLERIYPDNIGDIGYNELPTLKGISTIILREPLEHLQSALHTELLGWLQQHPTEILSTENMIPLINNFITNELNPFGTTHWDVTYYEHLYKFWKRNRTTLKVIHVSNLTDFIKQKYEIDKPHDKFSYGIFAHGGQFKYAYTTKQKLAKWIEETLPDMWNDLIKDIPKADKFYNLMINDEISEMYELEEQIMELEAQITELKTKIDKLEKFIYVITPSTKKKII